MPRRAETSLAYKSTLVHDALAQMRFQMSEPMRTVYYRNPILNNERESDLVNRSARYDTKYGRVHARMYNASVPVAK